LIALGSRLLFRGLRIHGERLELRLIVGGADKERHSKEERGDSGNVQASHGRVFIVCGGA
jgi:hypothetical protein